MENYNFTPYDVLQIKRKDVWLDFSTLRTDVDAHQAVDLVRTGKWNGETVQFRITDGRDAVKYPVEMADAFAERMVAFAEVGHRIVVNGRTIWKGLGNRSGLHDYADTVLRAAMVQGEARLRAKLAKLERSDEIEVFDYVNTTRERGRWVLIARPKVR